MNPPSIPILPDQDMTYFKFLRGPPGVSAQLRSMPSKLRQASHLPVATSAVGSGTPDPNAPVGASARGRKAPYVQERFELHACPGRSIRCRAYRATRRFSIEPSPVDAG